MEVIEKIVTFIIILCCISFISILAFLLYVVVEDYDRLKNMTVKHSKIEEEYDCQLEEDDSWKDLKQSAR